MDVFERKSITFGEQSKTLQFDSIHGQWEQKPIDFDCLHRQTLVFLMADEGTVRLFGNVCLCMCVCVCASSGFLDEPSLEVRGAAWGAAEQQVLLVDQAVQQILLSVVVVHLQEGHHCNPKPGEPGSPKAKLQRGNHCNNERDLGIYVDELMDGWMDGWTDPVLPEL